MDSLTLTSVYTYAMITICADSWNSRSVLWPMMFFGAAINRLEKKVTPRFSSDFSPETPVWRWAPPDSFFFGSSRATTAPPRRRRRDPAPDIDRGVTHACP